MAFPAQIVLPPGNEVYRAGQPRPAQPVRGSIIIGRVLAPIGGELLTTAEGAPAARVQFPIGTVLVPIEGSVEGGTQVFAQVRQQNGQLLLAILEQFGRGTVLEATALESAIAGGSTTIDLDGEPAPVATTQALNPGERLLAQVQPRGTRAILQALPPVFTGPQELIQGTIVSVEGPQATVQVQGVNLLGRGLSPVSIGEQVPVQVIATESGREVAIGTPAVVQEAAASEAARIATSPANDAVIRELNLPVNAATRTAVSRLLQGGSTVPAPGESPTTTAITITAATVRAAVALESAQIPIDAENLRAATALLDARIAVTPDSVQAARHFIQLGAPVTRPAISAAVALLEIAVAPTPTPTQALANSLFSPSTLSVDLTVVLDGLTVLAEEASVGPTRESLAALTRALADLQVRLTRPEPLSTQLQYAAKYGGTQTERFLGALTESSQAAPAAATVLPEAAQDAARDLRVLLGEANTLLERSAAEAALPDATRSAVSDAIGRISERLQGLQLQNLRAPFVEHLTLELPAATESGLKNVQIQVYYRQNHREDDSQPAVDPRNTTVAVLLDTTQLGAVSTTVGITNGVLTTDFRVDTPEIADLLMSEAGELREALDALGYDVNHIQASARHTAAKDTVPEVQSRLDADGIDVTI